MALGSSHFQIELDEALGLVRITRTAEPMPKDLVEVRRIFGELVAPLRRLAGKKALLDLRNGRGRNDDDFESASGQISIELRRNFTRVAVLVGSAVGKLQVKRLTGARSIFSDEAEALRYLDG